MLKIIIPTCGAVCLDHLQTKLLVSIYSTKFSEREIEVLLIANSRDTESRERIAVLHRALRGGSFHNFWSYRYIEFPDRIGYGRAVDFGWKLADPQPNDYIAVLNDDVVIEGDWITPLVERLQERPKRQVGPSLKYIGPDGLGYITSQTVGPLMSRCHYSYLEGWCWMARAETITRAGGIVDLGFEGGYCEDCDLSIRIAESGGRILLVDAPIRHIGHGSSSQETQAQWAKNRQYLAEKWDLRHGGRRGSPARNGG